MKKKSYLLNFILFLSSLVLCLIISEIGLRIILFTDIKCCDVLRNPNHYTDPYSEDENWKLKYLFKKIKNDRKRKQKKHIPQQKRNEKLFTRLVLRDTYKHVNLKYVNNRRPVLLYGDSFAACYSQAGCFEHILNNDKDFSRNNYLLNYGVGGFGLDQIYFMFKNSIDNYNNPFVVISLMTLDLDRSILTVRDVPKTFYTLENNMLKLHERPMPYPDIGTYYSNYKPQIVSYLYRMIIYNKYAYKYLPHSLTSYLKGENHYRRRKIRINEKIMLEIIDELTSRKLDFIFLIFHPDQVRGVGDLNENIKDWRSTFIRRILDENNIPYIWSKDIILQNMKDENLSLNDHFIPGDGHPTTLQKELLAERIKEFVLNSDFSS